MEDSTYFKTRWSLIALARKGEAEHGLAAAQALEELTRRYRPTILGAIRRSGIPQDDCEDVCQEFLQKIFLDRAVPKADPSKGRFRTFLIHLLRNSILDWQRKACAQKRGAGKVFSVGIQEEEIQNQMVDFHTPSVELDFEMDFAQQIHDQVVEQLRASYTGRDQLGAFEALLPYVLVKQDDGAFGPLAETLGKPEATLRQILSRLRQRYGQLFREQVKEIVSEENELEDELRHILKLLLAAQNRKKPASEANPKA